MYSNILIPVVFDEGHDTQASFLAARALANDDARFTVLHVMDPIPAYVASQIPADVLAKSRDRTERELKEMAAALPGATTVLESGHAGRFIVDYADRHGIDCIVLASHRPGIENLFLGSTADRVVRHAKCSVHVIR
ncbi:universal stress protein [Ruegeria marisrubri]|uniref:Universal stress protein n=1 Tax=Ruegeria marisrubri TaxID=1685379 RepID=A0A0X3TD13_9RHOB|nr:universal stress protein [Ruegeria marisrubri]KUJ73672.1 universal stress protein [Ruegeria marisrubri]